MNDILDEIELKTNISVMSKTIDYDSILDIINPDLLNEIKYTNTTGLNTYNKYDIDYELKDLINIYSVLELIQAGFPIDTLLNNSQNPSYFAFYLIDNKESSTITYDLIKIFNYGYTINDLSLNPIINNYYDFLFQTIVKINNQPEIFNSYFTFLFNIPKTLNDLLNIWNNDASVVRRSNSFLIYYYYYDLGINLQNINKLNFTKNEFIMINYYDFYKRKPLILLNEFYNNGFKALQLLFKNIYIIDNKKNDFNNLFINKDYIFYNNTSPFLYYNEINYTNLSYNYNQLYQTFQNYLQVNDNIITINSSTPFIFYDASDNSVKNYNKIYISENGWLSLLNNDTNLCTIRFFPYHVLPNEKNRTLQYNFDYVANLLIEIQMSITIQRPDTNTSILYIIIHLNTNGLITFYQTYDNNSDFIFDVTTLSYSSPDPNMIRDGLYYNYPMYYDISNNNTISSYSHHLKYNFGYLYDSFIGFTPRQLLNNGYSFQNLLDASCSAIEMRNAGYSASTLIHNYPLYEIIYAYNLNILDVSNLGYSLSNMKYFFNKYDYNNYNVNVEQLYTIGYTINDFLFLNYEPSDISGLNYQVLDYLSSNIILNPIYLKYVLDNVFNTTKLSDFYELITSDSNYYTTYTIQIETIFNNISIENIYDSGFSLKFIRETIYYFVNISKDGTFNLPINTDFISVYNLVNQNKITLNDLYDNSYSLYDFQIINTSIHNYNNAPRFSYQTLIQNGFSQIEIENYYFQKLITPFLYVNDNTLNVVIYFITPDLSIIYSKIFSDTYQYYSLDPSDKLISRNYTLDEKIILLYNLYNYEILNANNYGIDYILTNKFSLIKIQFLYIKNPNLPQITLTDIIKYGYNNAYDVFYLYYVFYGYNSFDRINDLLKSFNITDVVILFYFYSFYNNSFKNNFSFFDYVTNTTINYSINTTEIINFGHEVNNLIYYDISLNGYKYSTFNYSINDLYNNGFLLSNILSYYSLNDLYKNNFDLTILNTYTNYSINSLINAGYGVSDFKKYGYSIQLLYPTYYSLSTLKTGGYTVQDFISIPNISINDLKNIGFVLPDFADYFTVSQLKNEGYDEKQLNRSGTVLDYYCKKETCKNDTFQNSKNVNKNPINSKVTYSQNIQNKTSSYSTNYSNYVKNINEENLFCINNTSIPTTPSVPCSIPTKYNTTTSYFIRNYITKSINNQNITENQKIQHAINIINIQNKYQNITLLNIMNNYIYFIIQLELDYPNSVIEYLIVNNFVDYLNRTFQRVVDSIVKGYINDMIDEYSNNPTFSLSSIIDNYISNIGTI